MLWQLVYVVVGQTAADGDKLIAYGAGGIMAIVSAILALDRMGFLKRNGNSTVSNGGGNGDPSAIIKAINEGNDRVVHQLQVMNDRAESNAREILIALARQGSNREGI